MTTEAYAREETQSTADASGATATATGNINDPSTPHPIVLLHRDSVDTCRDLIVGTPAIQAGAEKYLPRYEAEPTRSYNIRRTLCALVNAFRRTVEACVGMVYMTDPILGEDNDAPIVDFWEAVDSKRTHAAVFGKRLLEEAVTTGISGIMTEYPVVPNAEALDAAQEMALRLRPYWVLIRREDIVSWRLATIGGDEVLTQLVLRECVNVDAGAFGTVVVTRYRVYRRTDTGITFQLYAPPADNPKGTPVAGAVGRIAKQIEIPFSPCFTGTVRGWMDVIPPLFSLAELNIDHHRVNTEHRNLMRLCGVPERVFTGLTPKIDVAGNEVWPDILIGPENVRFLPAGTTSKWDSPDSTALAHYQSEVQKIEVREGAMGMAFLSPDTRAAETAEAKRIDSNAQNGTLSSAARSEQDCLEMALEHVAIYMSTPSAPVVSGSVTVNRDFDGVVADPQLLGVLNDAAKNGNLSLETFLEVLERYKVLGEGFDVQAEIARITRGIGALPALQPAPVVDPNADALSTGSATVPPV